jgi:hypothetical protein
MPGTELPVDTPQAFVWAIAEAIRTVLLAVPYMGHVHVGPQYPSTPQEDDELTKVNDPVIGSKVKITNFAEISVPDPITQDTLSGNDEECTVTDLIFPIRYALGVTPKWVKDDFPYHSSIEMYVGIFFQAREKFRKDRTLGFSKHVTHHYLQQRGYDELTNDKGEALEHLGDWSLRVVVEGRY